MLPGTTTTDSVSGTEAAPGSSEVTSQPEREWKKVVTVNDRNWEFYGDNKSIRRSGDTVTLSVMMNFTSSAVPIGSRVGQAEYDCVERRYRQLSSLAYSETMGGGELVTSNNSSSDWRPIKPGSAGEHMLKSACER